MTKNRILIRYVHIDGQTNLSWTSLRLPKGVSLLGSEGSIGANVPRPRFFLMPWLTAENMALAGGLTYGIDPLKVDIECVCVYRYMFIYIYIYLYTYVCTYPKFMTKQNTLELLHQNLSLLDAINMSQFCGILFVKSSHRSVFSHVFSNTKKNNMFNNIWPSPKSCFSLWDS